jgi:RNA polymerase sigma-70 factor (ECF subfamily)
MNETVNSVGSSVGSSSVSPDHAQEHLWVCASQKGDTLAFNRLVLKWERTVYNIAIRMLQDREEAAEATQEIFLRAFKSIRRFRKDSKFSTWLYRIALNHCISIARHRPPGTQLSLDETNAAAYPAIQMRTVATQSSDLIRSEERKRVLAALSHLPPDQRAVVELKFFQELTFEDIAAVLETPLSTIKSRLYAGLEMLKIRLGAGS